MRRYYVRGRQQLKDGKACKALGDLAQTLPLTHMFRDVQWPDELPGAAHVSLRQHRPVSKRVLVSTTSRFSPHDYKLLWLY